MTGIERLLIPACILTAYCCTMGFLVNRGPMHRRSWSDADFMCANAITHRPTQPEAPSGLGLCGTATTFMRRNMDLDAFSTTLVDITMIKGQGFKTILQCDDKGRRTRVHGSSSCRRNHEGEMSLMRCDDTRTQERRSQEPMITKWFRCRGNRYTVDRVKTGQKH